MSSSSSSSNLWQFATFLLVGIIAGYLLSLVGDDSSLSPSQPSNPDEAFEETGVLPEVDDDAVLGDPNAPITMIEFSDFECPYCERFSRESLPLIIENYVNTGKVKLVYRDLPLGGHALAIPAAEAAECAGEQGKFYEMHDVLFSKYSEWTAAGVAEPVVSFKGYAAELGLNVEAFNGCVDSHAMIPEIQKDVADAMASGRFGTPTFFINGQRVIGAQPYAVFSGIFDQILAQQ